MSSGCSSPDPAEYVELVEGWDAPGEIADLRERARAAGALRFGDAVLDIGGEPAARLALREEGGCLVVEAVTEMPAFARHSPGLLLLADAVSRALARGRRVFVAVRAYPPGPEGYEVLCRDLARARAPRAGLRPS